MLKHDFDNKKTLSNLIKNSIDVYLTKKITILKQAIHNTYKRYDINQAKLALRTYYKEQNAELFSRSTKTEAGRGTITKELEIPIIKYVIGAKMPIEYGYLLDDYENKFSITKHITILDRLVETILNEYIN